MKKLWTLLLTCLLCLSSPAFAAAQAQQAPLRVVCTIFPPYDWVRQVLGEAGQGAQLTLLQDSGVDLHSYQPTAADIASLAACDLFIYVGGESDQWVEDALEAVNNPNMRTLSLLSCVQAREEELVEGMQAEEEQDHGHGLDEDAHEAEYDEHVWLSLRNAAQAVEAIAGVLGDIDPENAQAYGENAQAYCQQLSRLDQRYQEAVEAASGRTLLVADRFPFRYLAEDYGLDYYAAFSGCSAETEASFATIAFLAGKADQLGLSTLVVLEGQDHSLAKTIIASTQTKDQSIVTMNSLQSVTGKDIEEGTTYLGVMEDNRAALVQALG